MNDLLMEIDSQQNLPSPSAVIARLTSLLQKDNISSQELATIAETDQAFTARILKLVNSPFYGFSRQITSVEESITMLGLDAVHQLLLTTSVLNSLKTENKIFNINQFWLHSFGVGVFAKHLLSQKDKDTHNEAFMCGISHDIGRLIYLKFDPEKYFAFFDKGESVTDLDKEKKWFGFDHQEVGGALGRKWNFPSSFVVTIENHHTPEKAPDYKLLVSAVNIADIFCHAINIGDSGNKFISSFNPASWKILEVKMDDLKSIINNAVIEIDQIIDILADLNKL